MRRSDLDICADILVAAKSGAKKTHIVYRANLNFKLVRKYLRRLIENGLLHPSSEKKVYTTDEGMDFLEQYRKLNTPLRKRAGLSSSIWQSRGLSNVVSTLIILVVTVLLATMATYYATNIAMTRTAMEELRLSQDNIWVNSTGSVATIKINNIGGKDIAIDKLTVRGTEVDWASVYYYRVPSDTVISSDLGVLNPSDLNGSSVTIGGYNYTRASDDIPLISGGGLLIYINGAGNIQMDDIGTTVGINVFTNNAQYITECNVRSATQQ